MDSITLWVNFDSNRAAPSVCALPFGVASEVAIAEVYQWIAMSAKGGSQQWIPSCSANYETEDTLVAV